MTDTTTDTANADAAAASGCPVAADIGAELFEPGSQENWFESYKVLHNEAPIARIPGKGWLPGADAFIVSKFEDIASITRDPRFFDLMPEDLSAAASAGSSEIESEMFREEGFGDTVDAAQTLRPTVEQHKRYRMQLWDPWVGPEGAERHRDMVRAAVNGLIDRWIDDGEVEYVTQFAAPLPQTVITPILGLPLDEKHKLQKIDEAQVRRFVYGDGPRNELSEEVERENAAVLVDFHRYIQQQVDEKRENPKEDMISFLTQVDYEGRKLSDGEIISIAVLMHIGGNETTQYALTSEALLLAQHPELVQEMREDPGKIRFFVEEALRLYAPTQGGAGGRYVPEDMEIRGVHIPKGSLLHLRFGAGNRDADLCPAPGELRLDRKNPGRHLTFSMGPRNCPGQGISRLEQNIATEVLIDRLDNIRFAPGKNDFTHQPGIMLGLYELHLEFDKR
ncbi:MAG: cytochrome P450 [Dehalococcoidia bacterium]|nr:cytochrome P450 [Dehalococcoidia bacterium]